MQIEMLDLTTIPAIIMLICFIGIVASIWIALDPIRQKQRKPKYFLLTLLFFIGFLLAGYWDMKG